MNKKLLAVAVAGALAAPGVALAQSSVTISGYLKAGIDSFKISQPAAGRSAAGTNLSETRVTDHSSRILFNVVEDLGGGLQAIGQFDLRLSLDAVNRSTNAFLVSTTTGSAGNGFVTTPSVNTLNSGNNHVGLRSKNWGSIRFGRQDTHYGNSGDTLPSKAGHLGAWNSSVFDAVQRPGGTNGAIASLSRTANLMWYDSPKWGGFGFMIGYSTNPTRTSTTPEYENDLGSDRRKGRAWTFNPVYNGGNWEVAWSHWNAKSDWSGALASGATNTGCGGTTAGVSQCELNREDDQKSDSIRGHYIFPMGLRVGLAWNSSKLTNQTTGLVTGKRSAWALPISYNTGAHTFYMTYTKAGDSKDVTSAAGVVTAGSNTGAKLISLAYNYDLSKRTSVGVTYAKLTNKAAGRYNTFYTGDSAFGGTAAGALAGEDQRLFGLAVRHNF